MNTEAHPTRKYTNTQHKHIYKHSNIRKLKHLNSRKHKHTHKHVHELELKHTHTQNTIISTHTYDSTYACMNECMVKNEGMYTYKRLVVPAIFSNYRNSFKEIGFCTYHMPFEYCVFGRRAKAAYISFSLSRYFKE